VPLSIVNVCKDESAVDCAYWALYNPFATTARGGMTDAVFEILKISLVELRDAVDTRTARAYDTNGKPAIGAHFDALRVLRYRKFKSSGCRGCRGSRVTGLHNCFASLRNYASHAALRKFSVACNAEFSGYNLV